MTTDERIKAIETAYQAGFNAGIELGHKQGKEMYLTCFTGMEVHLGADNKEGKMLALKGEVSYLRSTLADSSSRIAELEALNATLQADLDAANAKPANGIGGAALAKLEAEVNTMKIHLTTASSHIAELLAQNATLQADLDAANAKLATIPTPVTDEPVAVKRTDWTDFGTYPPLPDGVEIGEGFRQLALGEILEPRDEELVPRYEDEALLSNHWKTIHYLHAGNKCGGVYRRKVKTTGPVIHATEGPANA